MSSNQEVNKIFDLIKENDIKFVDFRFCDYNGKWLHISHCADQIDEEKLVEAAMTIQGSGWVYLTKTGTIKTTPNQSYKPDVFMPIDMWEHSFTDYVPAKDAKVKYIKGVLRLIDWNAINRRLEG